jgi:hypothetical protein
MHFFVISLPFLWLAVLAVMDEMVNSAATFPPFAILFPNGHSNERFVAKFRTIKATLL